MISDLVPLYLFSPPHPATLQPCNLGLGDFLDKAYKTTTTTLHRERVGM